MESNINEFEVSDPVTEDLLKDSVSWNEFKVLPLPIFAEKESCEVKHLLNGLFDCIAEFLILLCNKKLLNIDADFVLLEDNGDWL